MPEGLRQEPDGKTRPEHFTLARSFSCALQGVATVFNGRNFRIQLCFAVAALVLGAVFRIPVSEWLAIIACIGMVLGFECLNTAIEAVVDLASPEWHPLAKKAKDAAAGAALVVSVAAFAVGVILFAPRLLACMGLI